MGEEVSKETEFRIHGREGESGNRVQNTWERRRVREQSLEYMGEEATSENPQALRRSSRNKQ